jgi:ferredoxin
MTARTRPPTKADGPRRYPENAPGRFYVDTRCVDCDVCRDLAPANFAREARRGHAYVLRQPRTDEELALCQEALAACPVCAIGCDGE